MDKNDFYRELMKTYTVDTEKIKCNAKRGIIKKNTSSPLKWVSCVAACTAAAAAIAFFVNALPSRQPGIDVILDSNSERVYAAEQRFKELAATKDVMDMYVSLKEEHILKEILMIFSAVDNNGDIKLSLLYTSDGKYYKYSDKISEDIKFRAVKITAPAKLYDELNSLKAVSLAEPVEGSDYTDKNFVPYVEQDRYITDITFDNTIQITISDVIVPDDTTVPDTPPSETTSNDYQSEITTQEPDNTLKIPVADVKTAQFISSDKLIVTTSDSIRLFKLTEGALQLESTFYATEARVSYANTNGTVLYITACDANGRNRLFYADGEAGTLSEMDISSITVGESEIASVLCSGDGSVMIFKTVSTEKACIYYAVRSGSSISIVFAKEYGNPVSVISSKNGIVYTAVTDPSNAATKIYAVNSADGSEEELASYSEGVQFIRNSALDTAAIAVGEGSDVRYRLLTPEGTFIDITGSPAFSEKDSSVFKIGDGYFRLDNGALTELDENAAAEYFTVPDYPYAYKTNIFEDGTAEIILS